MAPAGKSEPGRRLRAALAAAVLSLATPAIAAEVLWTGRLPRAPLADEGIVLVDTPTGRTARLRPIAPPAELPPSLPVGIDLVPRADWRAFGGEERCRAVRRDGTLRIDCAAGRAPAGVLIGFDDAPPAGARLALDVAADGQGFAARMIRGDGDADRPLPLAAATRLPVDPGDRTLAVVAPADGGTLTIRSLTLAAAAPVEPQRATAWAWAPALWTADPGPLVARAAARGIGRLYVAVPIDKAVERPGRLAALVRAARAKHIGIVAVEGDPDMADPAGRAALVRRVGALAGYQAAAAAAARLAGLQLDIEPYIRPGWRGTAAAFAGWSATVAAAASRFGAPVELVTPFWISAEPEGRAFLDESRASISTIAIMAYRSDGARISAAAAPLLNWGAEHGVPVRVALENGRLADEQEQLFSPAARGTLVLAPDLTLTLYDKPVGGGDGATIYRAGSRTVVRGAALSFMDNEPEMVATASAGAAAFAAWPSFQGIAYHGIDWTR